MRSLRLEGKEPWRSLVARSTPVIATRTDAVLTAEYSISVQLMPYQEFVQGSPESQFLLLFQV